jgi:hypothetical protein
MEDGPKPDLLNLRLGWETVLRNVKLISENWPSGP